MGFTGGASGTIYDNEISCFMVVSEFGELNKMNLNKKKYFGSGDLERAQMFNLLIGINSY